MMIDLSHKILYEDEDSIVIDKPAGLIVHPDGRTEEPSVSGWFGEVYPKALLVGEPLVLGDGRIIHRPGVVHRIDRETSGVLLLAKTQLGYEAIKKQFQNREIEKIYHLFVYGNLKVDQGTINLPIARSASNFKKWSAERGTRGEKREALTYYQVIKRYVVEGVTFLEAKPKTGRTHQIRVHFKALHHPVVCDKLYAPSRPRLLGFDRLALHALRITFQTIDHQKIVVEAPYPADFVRAMDILG
jgi:23S rRNA pseudouridine1911/1915/1917 synthase